MKNKILPILCIFILISSIFISNNVFASSNVYNTLPEEIRNKIINNTVMPELADSSYKCFIWHNSLIGYVSWFFTNCSEDFEMYYDGTTWRRKGTASNCVEYVFDDSGNLISSNNDKLFDENSLLDDRVHNGYLYLQNIVVYSNNEKEIFFQGAPVTAVEIPALETAEQIPEAMSTALKMIIPVSLTVLSVVLGIYLVRRLIYQAL